MNSELRILNYELLMKASTRTRDAGAEARTKWKKRLTAEDTEDPGARKSFYPIQSNANALLIVANIEQSKFMQNQGCLKIGSSP
jgi:hypothetical protein